MVLRGRETEEKGEWEGAAGSPQVSREPLLSTSRNSEKLECRGPAPAEPGYSKERRLGEGQGITA